MDLFAATTFYESEAEGLSAEFLATVRDALDLLASNPRIGSLYEETTRRIVRRDFPTA